MRNLNALLIQPAEATIRTNLYNAQLVSEGHITGSRVVMVMVLVDFQARMDAVLKEMRSLVERVDPDHAMDFSKFPEVDAFMKTLVKPVEAPASTSGGMLGSLLAQPLTNIIPGSAKDIPVPDHQEVVVTKYNFPAKPKFPERPPSVPQMLLPRESSQILQPSAQPTSSLGSGRGSGKVSGRGSGRIRSDLSNRWGGVSNPARDHPERFEHMQQPPPSKGKSFHRLRDNVAGGAREVGDFHGR